MATDNFTDVWAKLKDLHEQEVRGLYSKLTEINTERCLDAQRLEEMFNKNNHLKEHYKIMNDNVKVLEDRLRAGLCDRCTVSQELARKKQQEYETSQLQSLQHISVLAHEINGLKEENKLLHQELRNLKFLLQQSQTSPRGNRSLSDDSTPLDSSFSKRRRQSLDAALSPRSEHQKHQNNFRLLSQESIANPKNVSCQNLPEISLFDWHPRRISNQLHGTIAVVQTGTMSCRTSEKDVASLEFGVKLKERRCYEEPHNWPEDCRRNEHSTKQSIATVEKQTEGKNSHIGLCANIMGSGNGSTEKPLDLSNYSKNKESPWNPHRTESPIQYEPKKARFKEPIQKKCAHDRLANEKFHDKMHSHEMVAEMVSVESPRRDKDETQDVLSPKEELKMIDSEDKVYKNLNIKAQYDSTFKSGESDNNPRIATNLSTKLPKTVNGGNPNEVHLQILNAQSDFSQSEVDNFQESHETQEIKTENEKHQSKNPAGQPRKKKKKRPQDYWTSASYKRGRRLKKYKVTHPAHTHSSQCAPKTTENRALALPELVSGGQN
ncbi:DNA endonuclease RBBP8 isoform X2 [Narcine bancroftii]|uniref:DNA endonuclease RBBP8 isoform X2 n=1 Tax=Narcine bancroftii TaxID=1343680 RepID=UPI0038319082